MTIDRPGAPARPPTAGAPAHAPTDDRPDLAGFAAPARGRGRRVGAGLLTTAVLAGSISTCARYAPWRPIDRVEADGAGASATTTTPTTVPSTVTTSTVPETTTVPSTDPPTTMEAAAPVTTAPPPPPPPTTRRTTTRAASTPPRAAATPLMPAGGGWHGEMLASVNAERAKAGVRPLVACGALNRAAQNYADTMAASGVLSHTGPDGSTLASRVRAAGYNMAPGGGYVSYAENIARGQTSVGSVMAGWMNSSGHRTNLLAAGTTHLGMGRNGVWWVQNFGSGGTC